MTTEKPIAYCPLNDVEAYAYPFYIKKGVGVEADQLLLGIHFLHLTDEERRFMGPVLEINGEEDLLVQGFTRDERGVYIID